MHQKIKIFAAVLILVCSLTGCATQPHTTLSKASEEPEPVPTPVARVVDYVDVYRNPDEYDKEFICVAGQITNFSSTDKHSFYFNDRLGRDEDGIGFEITVSHVPGSQGVGEIYTVGDFVIVEGVWHTGMFSSLREATVTQYGEEAERLAKEYLNTWKQERMALSKSTPIINYMEVIQDIGSFTEKYIRIVGIVSSTGTNTATHHLYFLFRDVHTNHSVLSISLKGCPQEMQNICKDGEYVILSGKIATSVGGANFGDCYVECVGETARKAYDSVMSGQPFTPPIQQVTQNGQYIASTDSDKYHCLSCRWAEKVLPANTIYFNSPDEAMSAGYAPCGTCNP